MRFFSRCDWRASHRRTVGPLCAGDKLPPEPEQSGLGPLGPVAARQTVAGCFVYNYAARVMARLEALVRLTMIFTAF